MREWVVTVQAPVIKPVRKRKTGKLFQRTPFLNSNDRDHWRVTSPIRAEWRRLAAEAAAGALPQGLGRVEITGLIVKPRAGTYDAQNYYPTAKAIVDGFIDHGLCADDSNEYVAGPFLFPGPKGAASVILTVTELS
jgi:hypothetical protein